MTNKIAFLGVSILSCLVFSEAQAHFICLSNKTSEPQEIELIDAQGQRELVRLDGRENTCADVDDDWQEFKATMPAPAENLCQNKRVFPGQWLVIETKNGKTDCTAQMDRESGKPTLKDYSHPFYIKNTSVQDHLVTQRPDDSQRKSVCGYFEWLPMMVKSNKTERIPVRMINTGSCFYTQTVVYGLIAGAVFDVHTSCINCGVGISLAYPARDNMKAYRDSDHNAVYLDIW